MDRATRSRLEKRFDFAGWKSAPRGARRLSTSGVFDVGGKLGRWTVSRAQAVPFPAARAAYRFMWQESRSNETLLRLDLVEAASAAAAREIVLELLGQFESPQIQPIANPPAGELAFGAPGNTVILFARANVVAMIRNAGREVVTVVAFARLVDRRLTGQR